MPSNMDLDILFSPAPEGVDIYEKIQHCEKTVRTIRRAVLMRLFLTALLLYIPFAAKVSSGIWILMGFVMLINVSGLIPLMSQWRIKKKELDKLLDEEE